MEMHCDKGERRTNEDGAGKERTVTKVRGKLMKKDLG